MKPFQTETANTVFKAKDCEDLPATNFRYGDGTAAVETAWELSEQELAEVQETGTIYLYVLGGGQPPVKLTTKSQLELTQNDE